MTEQFLKEIQALIQFYSEDIGEQALIETLAAALTVEARKSGVPSETLIQYIETTKAPVPFLPGLRGNTWYGQAIPEA